jgi:hypothetical protein
MRQAFLFLSSMDRKIFRHLSPILFPQYELQIGTLFCCQIFAVFRNLNCKNEENENPSENISIEKFLL